MKPIHANSCLIKLFFSPFLEIQNMFAFSTDYSEFLWSNVFSFHLGLEFTDDYKNYVYFKKATGVILRIQNIFRYFYSALWKHLFATGIVRYTIFRNITFLKKQLVNLARAGCFQFDCDVGNEVFWRGEGQSLKFSQFSSIFSSISDVSIAVTSSFSSAET